VTGLCTALPRDRRQTKVDFRINYSSQSINCHKSGLNLPWLDHGESFLLENAGSKSDANYMFK